MITGSLHWALAAAGPGHHLLIRRSITCGELAFYCCWAPKGATLAELVKVAGARWAVEECFATAKNETALDHYQVRKHTAWYRHATLAMCAMPGSRSPPPPAAHRQANLQAVARRGPMAPAERGQPPCGQRSALAAGVRDHHITHRDERLVHLSMNEIRRLHATLHRPAHPPAHHLHWSRWRRRHQATARRCHYQARRRRQ